MQTNYALLFPFHYETLVCLCRCAHKFPPTPFRNTTRGLQQNGLFQRENIFDIRQQKYFYIVFEIIIPFTSRKDDTIALKCHMLAQNERRNAI